MPGSATDQSRDAREGPRKSLRLCRCRSLPVLLFLFILGPPGVQAQTDLPVVLAAGTHSLTAPWYLGPVNDRLNPAFLLGTDHSLRSGEDWTFFYGVNVGFFQHHWWMTGISLEPEVGVGRRLPGGMHADLRLGLGYMHYFWRRQTLALKDGSYVEATDWGKPSVILPLSLTLGYRGNRENPLTVSPFVSARWGVQGLFLEEVPAMTHLFLLGGVRIEREPDGSPDGS